MVEGVSVALRDVVIHAWSWLNYKPVYSDHNGMPSRRAFPESTAMWVPEEDQKRLAAYKLLAAYDSNQSAQLAEVAGDHHARERREFGDPAMFIDTVMSHVLGREQTITVPGADHDGEQPTPDEAMAARIQDLLRTWAEDELLPMRIQQCERKAVTLGDGVYRLAWEPGRMRPTVRVHDPGFYFPVLPEDGDAGDYPTRVHFAWELPADERRGLKARLRRITYELDWIRPATASGMDVKGRPVRALLPVPETDLQEADAATEADIPAPPLTPGDLYFPDTGAIARQYPWNDTPSYVTCYLTDATWNLEDLKGAVDVDSLPLGSATFATRGDGEVLDHLDLIIDFVPVVHLPNTVPPAEEHWGQSSLAKVLQVFDELASSDTDSAKASATTGAPMIGLWGKAAGSSIDVREVVPGMLLKLGEGGGMTALDTSKNLAELRSHVHDLSDRAAKVARLPAVALGTADPAQVPSGYALELSLGPLDALIASMRLARDHKYALLLKMVQRLYLAGQHPDWAGITPMPARIAFGSYKPTDKSAVLDQVSNGVDKGVMSLETAVKMLDEAGFPIDDVQAEIERIQSRQFDKARTLADATGDTGLVGDFLGVKVNEPAPAPAPQLPATPGGQNDPAAAAAGQGSGGNT
ncbi:hypothetical protein [Streptomyces sp. NBC_00847]|uniref:hypothetical protein n=1 Tax=Streptomyces sp. NBC_00847 TaxID=2975850 RepID=UPI00225DE64B|nr:hypothetical protein [Streptomyces sp. NBC_00847]MCX4885873.1 hypothetical protein [Streptomyces sp. NBC_00847]